MDAKKRLVMRHSLISGDGTFADEFIAKGSHIATLSGTPMYKDHIVISDDPLQIDANTYLILDLASKTINHSCEPNTGIRLKADLYALRDIQSGEEITYDYATTIGSDDHISNMPCSCKKKHCRKIISNFLSIGKKRLAEYQAANALPEFILDELQGINKKQKKSA